MLLKNVVTDCAALYRMLPMFCTTAAAAVGFVMTKNNTSATPMRVKTLFTLTRPPVLARRELPVQ